MTQQQRMPTSLKRLNELLIVFDSRDDGLDKDTADFCAWLRWTYNHLEARNQYHKKQRVRQQLLVKMAQTLLSGDELAEVDKQAESELE